jgi:hypothetical protein
MEMARPIGELRRVKGLPLKKFHETRHIALRFVNRKPYNLSNYDLCGWEDGCLREMPSHNTP